MIIPIAPLNVLSNTSQLEKYYDLNYTIVSLIFLSPFAGYTMAAFLNNMVHVKFGQRGVAVVGPACHLISYIVLAAHPPYPVLVVIFILVGFGNGLIDAAWCAWIGNMASANEVSGFLQACYSLGATVSPLMATAMFTKGSLSWYTFYYLMVGNLTCRSILYGANALMCDRFPFLRLSFLHPQLCFGNKPVMFTSLKIQSTRMAVVVVQETLSKTK
jgi:fucose permease